MKCWHLLMSVKKILNFVILQAQNHHFTLKTYFKIVILHHIIIIITLKNHQVLLKCWHLLMPVKKIFNFGILQAQNHHFTLKTYFKIVILHQIIIIITLKNHQVLLKCWHLLVPVKKIFNFVILQAQNHHFTLKTHFKIVILPSDYYHYYS